MKKLISYGYIQDNYEYTRKGDRNRTNMFLEYLKEKYETIFLVPMEPYLVITKTELELEACCFVENFKDILYIHERDWKPDPEPRKLKKNNFKTANIDDMEEWIIKYIRNL